MFDLEEELKKLPAKPGVYIMHDKTDNIIYVGKAISLKNRVRQYFQAGRNVSPKIERMISQIASFEYIITDSEVEALVLECNLIKEHSPKYNTMLKDDKGYPYIKATINEPFPRLLFSHQRKKDNAKYYGPYTSVGAMKDTLEFLRKTFKLRTCNKKCEEGKKDGRVCLYYHIGQCSAPCQGYITREEYLENYTKALNVLDGNAQKTIAELKKLMEEAAADLRFEEAAAYRDKIEKINKIGCKQKATDGAYEDRDVIAMASAHDEAVVQVFFIRSGKMIGREHHYLTGVMNENEEDIIATFIKQYYADCPFIPRELMVPCEIKEASLIEEWLTKKRGQKVYIKNPKIGEKSRLVELARKNASMVLVQDSERIRHEQERTIGAMKELGLLIGLEGIRRIESYDISNTNGFESVGSMVVFEDGKARKRDYRKFKIKTVTGPDDYSSMREVLTRRFAHGLKEIEEARSNGDETEIIRGKFSNMPDLILMDGGKGQVNIALEVLNEYGLNIPVCGMVKDDNHRTRGLYFENEEVPMKRGSESFRLVTRIQDETHRFAIEYHKSLRSKGQIRSILDDIEGIGPTRRKALMRHFKSQEAIREASVEELAAVESMNNAAAEKVYEFFRKKDN